jgi:uncharacterized protein (TIGR02996 family)
MNDDGYAELLAAASEGDLDALLVLADFLEERGDERATVVRGIHQSLYDLWMFAPLAFQHFRITARRLDHVFSCHG